MPKQGKNIIVTCGNAADIDNIDKLGSYLERKYDIHQKQISYLLLCGHGVRHRISQSYYAYSLAVPYLKCPPHDGLGFVGDLFDPPRSNNGLCQQSTEDYVKCFANLLKDEAIVTLQSCSSSTKYDVDMPLLGTASMAKRVKYYLNQNGGLFNVIGISGISAYYPEQGAWFTNYDIPFRPNYTGGYGAGEE